MAYDKDCDHIYGNMAKWPRKCFRCGGDEADIEFDSGFAEIEKAIERGKAGDNAGMPEEIWAGYDIVTLWWQGDKPEDDEMDLTHYRLKSTVDAELSERDKTIRELSINLAVVHQDLKSALKNIHSVSDLSSWEAGNNPKAKTSAYSVACIPEWAAKRSVKKLQVVLEDNAPQIAEAKLTEILDAPAQDNPELNELMGHKAPWREEPKT